MQKFYPILTHHADIDKKQNYYVVWPSCAGVRDRGSSMGMGRVTLHDCSSITVGPIVLGVPPLPSMNKHHCPYTHSWSQLQIHPIVIHKERFWFHPTEASSSPFWPTEAQGNIDLFSDLFLPQAPVICPVGSHQPSYRKLCSQHD